MYFFLQKWIIVHRVLSYCISDIMGFPDGASGKESACQFRKHKRHRFSPWEEPLEKGMATHSSILA